MIAPRKAIIRLRPVTACAALSAIRLAFVPLLVEADHVDRREAAAENPGQVLLGLAHCRQTQPPLHGVV